jgi:hypothetical protein
MGLMAVESVKHRGPSNRKEPSVRGTLGVSNPTRKRRKETPVEQPYVAIDLHRRRSMIVRMNDADEMLKVTKIDNDPLALSMAIAEAGPNPEVALEATYGWYWAVDLLQAEGASVHLVHPLGLHWDSRRVKNDLRDSTELAHRLRRNDLPEAWIAPPEVRELRELVRYRAKLTALRSRLRQARVPQAVEVERVSDVRSIPLPHPIEGPRRGRVPPLGREQPGILARPHEGIQVSLKGWEEVAGIWIVRRPASVFSPLPHPADSQTWLSESLKPKTLEDPARNGVSWALPINCDQ